MMTSGTVGLHPLKDWRYWIPRIVVSLLVPFLVFTGTELALRQGNIGYATDLLMPCTIDGVPGSCYNVFFLAQYFPPGIIKLPVVYGIPTEKPKSTFRIFVLGESAAMGDPDPAFAFSRYLELMLQQRFPGVDFQVVNTASVAINSHVLLPIAKGLSTQKPDLFIIYSGNNEVVGPYGPGTTLTGAESSLIYARSDIFVRSTRIGQFLTRAAAPRKQWTGMEMFLDHQIPADTPALQQAYKNYSANLQDTIRVAGKAGAGILVSTVVTNLADCAPFGSQHQGSLSARDLQSWDKAVQLGKTAQEAGNFIEALTQYQLALGIDDQYAELEFRIARCLTLVGGHAEAKPHYIRARDLDTLRFRADSRINEINRAANSFGYSAQVVDAEAVLSAASPRSVVGDEMVYEHVHLTPHGNYLLALAMLDKAAAQVKARLRVAPVTVAAVLTEAECGRMLALTGFDRVRMTSEMTQRIQAAPFDKQLNHNEQVLYWGTQVEVAPENPQETIAQYQGAIAQRPKDRPLHFNFGAFLLDINQQAAYQEMRLSRPFDGFPVTSPDGTLQ
jgi:tetratricopeptide (TPR) repeat protein